jgi:hypothetical protein
MPENGKQYKINETAELENIQGDPKLTWTRVGGGDNMIEECSDYDENRLATLKDELFKMAKETCGFVCNLAPGSWLSPERFILILAVGA